MAISVSLHWLTVTALAVSLRFLHLTPAQSWVIVVMIFVVFSFFAWLRYRTGRWRVIQVVDRAPAALADEKTSGGF